MPELPILVRRLKPAQALLIACEVCGCEATISEDDLKAGEFYWCAQCGGHATYKYAEGSVCPNCDRLGWDTTDGGGCCSRRCALQLEHAQRLGLVA